jgi:hypothetical protein
LISLRNNLIKATGVGISVAAGVGAAWNPAAAIGATAGTIALSAGVLFPARFARFFLTALGGLLVGYAFLNKGFAYFGYRTIFVGEMTLALGLVALAVGSGVWLVLRSPLIWLLIAFALWGAFRTLPYVGVYGSNALRDGVVWGYGIFALLVPAILLRYGRISSVPEKYGRLLPWYLMWAPVASLIFFLAAGAVPRVPGSDVPLIFFKPGDAATHLAGCATFLALGLHQFDARRSRVPLWLKEWFCWLVWLAGFLVVSINRGGLVSVLVAASVVLALRPLSKWGKVILTGVIIVMLFFALDLEFDVGGARKVSPQQITASIGSVIGHNSREGLEETRRWRLEWWTDIVNYTFRGDYFWTGKGFGINLADDDGYQVEQEGALRSPHNGHMTILARAGVPGLLLWVLLQTAFAVSLLVAYFKARRAGQEWWARVNLWLLAYWSAFMVNGAFDVFLEGPQGGIWFWSLFGFGIAVLEAQRREGTSEGRAQLARSAA